MSVYVIVLALFYNGATHIYEYGNRGVTIEFPTKEACERVRVIEEKSVPKMLGPNAELRSILCVERPAKGGV